MSSLLQLNLIWFNIINFLFLLFLNSLFYLCIFQCKKSGFCITKNNPIFVLIIFVVYFILWIFKTYRGNWKIYTASLQIGTEPWQHKILYRGEPVAPTCPSIRLNWPLKRFKVVVPFDTIFSNTTVIALICFTSEYQT